MTKIKRNKKLLLEVLFHIIANPKDWDQFVWGKKTDCGTAFCYAGWAVQLAGHKITFSDGGSLAVIENGRHKYNIDAIARNDLGLTEAEDYLLFRGENTLVQLTQMVVALVRGKNITSDKFIRSLNFVDEIGCDATDDVIEEIAYYLKDDDE